MQNTRTVFGAFIIFPNGVIDNLRGMRSRYLVSDVAADLASARLVKRDMRPAKAGEGVPLLVFAAFDCGRTVGNPMGRHRLPGQTGQASPALTRSQFLLRKPSTDRSARCNCAMASGFPWPAGRRPAQRRASSFAELVNESRGQEAACPIACA